MSMLKIKKGDMVRIIAGADKDNEGRILDINRKKNTVIVEGAHMIKKHTKPSMANQAGGIIEQEGPIHISNVMLLVDGQPTRVGFRFENGKKVRYAKKTGKTID